MTRRIVTMCFVLAMATPVFAGWVYHDPSFVTGWRGGNNHSGTYCWLDAWPNQGGSWGTWQDATLAQFPRVQLQDSINVLIDAGGGWSAKLYVTQPSWITTDPVTTSPNLQPVVGVAQVDAAPIDWTGVTTNSLTAGLGLWALGGTTYSDFGAAVLAGVPTGQSKVYDVFALQAGETTGLWHTEGPAPYSVVMNVPQDLIVQYLFNNSATGIFASAKTPNAAALVIYQNQNNDSDIRVWLDAAPQVAVPWISPLIDNGAHNLWAERQITIGTAAFPIPVKVQNPALPGLSWTATVSPTVPWLSLSSSSGGDDSTFNMNVNLSTYPSGTYQTSVIISAPNAGNKTYTIPVRITVKSASPVIQLVPTSLSFQATPTGANPVSQTVTVNNAGQGTLAWTATVVGSATPWLTITAPGTGGNGGTFTVNVDKTGMTMGIYTGSISVSSTGATNTPQTVQVTLTLADQDANVTTANSYDDAWQSGPTGWAATMQAVRASRPAGVADTAGFCVFLGDSITYSSAFGAWARSPSNPSASDQATLTWSHAGTYNGTTNVTNDGWFLAKYDYPGRNGSFTARSGFSTAQYLAGGTYPDLPSMDQMFTAGFTNPDTGNKQYRDAQIAVILLGTNDLGQGATAAQVSANLSTMVNKLEADGIIPVLTTIPPRSGADATGINSAIRSLAQSSKLPLIDFYQEIMRRRPGTSWQGTLIGSDGVHPTGDNNGFTVGSDPYANSGAALSNVGYLLRTWLTVQKLTEIKAAVIDAPSLPPTPSNPSPADGASNVATNVTLSWSPTSGATFDVYLDMSSNPQTKVASALSTATFAPTLLQGTTYHWKVVATNGSGSTTGPIWSFTTKLTGDVNSNGYVNVGDLLLLVQAWGSQKTPPSSNWNPNADLNNDGYVNIVDLQQLVNNWGRHM